jgi:hypothetical protein
MKMAYDAGKIGLKEKVAAAKKAAKKAEKSLLLLGNSAEVIAQLEEDYDLTLGCLVRRNANKPRNGTWRHRPLLPAIMVQSFKVAYYAWSKWKLTGKGKPSRHYQGHLISHCHMKRVQCSTGNRRARRRRRRARRRAVSSNLRCWKSGFPLITAMKHPTPVWAKVL